jgi:hypothetical protein
MAHLAHYDEAAAAVRLEAVTEATNSKQVGYWERYLKFLQLIDLADDPFLHRLHISYQTRIISAFAAAIRENVHARADKSKSTEKLAAGPSEPPSMLFRRSSMTTSYRPHASTSMAS